MVLAGDEETLMGKLSGETALEKGRFMRILHVIPSYLPAVRYGGPIFAIHGLCKALAARGHESASLLRTSTGRETVPYQSDFRLIWKAFRSNIFLVLC